MSNELFDVPIFQRLVRNSPKDIPKKDFQTGLFQVFNDERCLKFNVNRLGEDAIHVLQ